MDKRKRMVWRQHSNPRIRVLENPPLLRDEGIFTNENYFINVNFLCKRKTSCPFLELFLQLLLLNGLQLYIIRMANRHALGWHILLPFMMYCPYLSF